MVFVAESASGSQVKLPSRELVRARHKDVLGLLYL